MSAPQFGETSTYRAVGVASKGSSGAVNAATARTGTSDKRSNLDKLIEASKYAEGLEAEAATVQRKKLLATEAVVAAQKKLEDLGYPVKVSRMFALRGSDEILYI